MASISDQGTGIQGTASFNGLGLINDASLSGIGPEGGEMSLEGLYYSRSGRIGSFGMNAMSIKSCYLPPNKKIQDSTVSVSKITGTIKAYGSHPEKINPPLGDANSYRLNGGKMMLLCQFSCT